MKVTASAALDAPTLHSVHLRRQSAKDVAARGLPTISTPAISLPELGHTSGGRVRILFGKDIEVIVSLRVSAGMPR